MPRTTLIPIPARTPAQRCAGPNCEAEIYFAPHPTTGRLHPVSVDPDYAAEHDLDVCAPSGLTDGQGFSHYADCRDAAHFRRGGR